VAREMHEALVNRHCSSREEIRVNEFITNRLNVKKNLLWMKHVSEHLHGFRIFSRYEHPPDGSSASLGSIIILEGRLCVCVGGGGGGAPVGVFG
jgi:hypothetical protein